MRSCKKTCLSFVGVVIAIVVLLAFMGVAFFIAGRILAKDDKLVFALGIFDILASLAIIGFYGLAITSIAM